MPPGWKNPGAARRWAKWLGRSLPIGGLIGTGYTIYHSLDGDEEYMPQLQIPAGWITICRTNNPLLWPGPKYEVRPGANACGFGGAVYGPATYYDPPPAGYEGYLNPPSWNSTDGWRMGFIGPSLALVDSVTNQIMFHVWHGRYPDPLGLAEPKVPSFAPVPMPQTEPEPVAEPQVERGPWYRPSPITMPLPRIVISPQRGPNARPGIDPRFPPLPPVPPSPPKPDDPPFGRAKKAPRPWSLPRLPPPIWKWWKGSRKPPPPGTKEEKIFFRGRWIRSQIAAANNATEVQDLSEALWWALPNSSRTEAIRQFGGLPSPWQRTLWAWTNVGKVQEGPLIKNLILNEAMDILGGIKGRLQSGSYQMLWQTFGMNVRWNFWARNTDISHNIATGADWNVRGPGGDYLAFNRHSDHISYAPRWYYSPAYPVEMRYLGDKWLPGERMGTRSVWAPAYNTYYHRSRIRYQ